VELKILKHLFTPEEAELAIRLTVIPETAGVVGRRSGMPAARVEKMLDKMARKGLILDVVSPGEPIRYQAAHFAIGIWEFQVDRLDPELVRYVEAYRASFIDEGWAKMPQIRTVPVHASIGDSLRTLPHERALKLLNRHDTFLVAPCICRRERALINQACSKPEHYCLILGSAAELFHRNGIGRFVDKSEMAEMIRQADDHGLVLQPSNARQITNICCCCGCCCGVLTSFKSYPRPGEMVHSAFVTVYDRSLCTGCGVCVDRCPMEALRMDGEAASFAPERCIGCGLCNTTCPTQALTLTRRPAAEQPMIPATFERTMLRLARRRGKLGLGELAATVFRSRVDRFLC
jgi:ferredoxin